MNRDRTPTMGSQPSLGLSSLALLLLSGSACSGAVEPDAEAPTTQQASRTEQPSSTEAEGRLAFVAEDGAMWDIYVLDVKGGEPTPLTAGLLAQWPRWSPDGRRIAFMNLVEENNVDIFVLELDSGERVNVTNDPARDMWPTWSPDGTRIAFVSQQDNAQGEIYVVNADGSDLQRLTDNELTEAMPAWSPR